MTKKKKLIILCAACAAVAIAAVIAISAVVSSGGKAVALNVSELTMNVGEVRGLVCSAADGGDLGKAEWSVNDASVVSCADGRVVALARGKATITAAVGSKKAVCSVTVVDEKTYSAIVSAGESMYAGDSVELTAKVAENGEPVDEACVVTLAEGKEYVSFSDGIVTALKAGKAVFSITNEKYGVNEKFAVEIFDAAWIAFANDRLSINVYEDADIGKAYPLELTAEINKEPASTEEITLESDDAFLEIKDGDVLPKAFGKTRVRATLRNVSAYCEVEIKDYRGYKIISDAAGWFAVENDLAGKYVLDRDIDLGGIKLTENQTIGKTKGALQPDDHNPGFFSGIIDGNGFAIKNFDSADKRADGSSVWSSALLWTVTGEIKNLSVKCGVYYTANQCGVLCYRVYGGGKIDNVFVSVEKAVFSGSNEISGVVCAFNVNSTVSDCTAVLNWADGEACEASRIKYFGFTQNYLKNASAAVCEKVFALVNVQGKCLPPTEQSGVKILALSYPEMEIQVGKSAKTEGDYFGYGISFSSENASVAEVLCGAVIAKKEGITRIKIEVEPLYGYTAANGEKLNIYVKVITLN